MAVQAGVNFLGMLLRSCSKCVKKAEVWENSCQRVQPQLSQDNKHTKKDPRSWLMKKFNRYGSGKWFKNFKK
jgi:hypothetical protein